MNATCYDNASQSGGLRTGAGLQASNHWSGDCWLADR